MNGRVYFQYIEGEPNASISAPPSHRDRHAACVIGESFDPADPTFREHYNIWSNRPSFWTMAMHLNSKRSVVQVARMYGFQLVKLQGHAGKSHPSNIDGPDVPQKAGNGNILFQKVPKP